jgi:acyl-CoA reductase-like NAD-dependent aldehyde dehydrogenase
LLLAALGDALCTLSGHFSAIVAEETGQEPLLADEEMAHLVALLRAPSAGAVVDVAVVSGASKSLAAAVGQAVSALAAGATLLVCPAPEAPSALFALAELSGRCGFPPGVINVVYPNAEALAYLRSVAGVTVLP